MIGFFNFFCLCQFKLLSIFSFLTDNVLFLLASSDGLDALMARVGGADLAAACFRFLPDRVRLDLAGWAAEDIFAHS